MKITASDIEKLERELHLKQLQIKSILTITQAINDNVSALGLYNMYRSFLNWEMGVKRMALFVTNESDWEIASSINVDESLFDDSFGGQLSKIQRLYKVNSHDEAVIRQFDVIIPVFHKEVPIAYALIGECNENQDFYSKIQFITTITNIVAVAIENKRLFKKQLEQERLRREIELASEVQNMLIPSTLPKNKSFELASIYKPHYTVGGDYFDYVQRSENSFVVCIADISGKGVAAALLMANFQSNLRILAKQSTDVVELVKLINRQVYEVTKSDRYLTLFVAYVDLKKQEIEYVNAGHYPPILHCNSQIHLLKKGCTVVGAFEELKAIEKGILKLSGEVTLMLYTDGLTDLKNVKGEYFNNDQLGTFIQENCHHRATELNEILLQKLQRFNAEPDFPDDIAILTCKLFLNKTENGQKR